MLKHTKRRAELAAARAPLSRLVQLLGDGSFAWCDDGALHPGAGPQAAAHAAALETYASVRRASRVGASARAALKQLAAADAGDSEDEAPPFRAPWGPDSDSEAEEAEAAALAAAGVAVAGTAAAATKLEKQIIVGLTPDWITDACCDVFGLTRPSVVSPVIRGLLDPCCNNKKNPNLPAELLYDKADDGLALRNSWADHFVLLNPPYESALQWRFINRAIDEVRRCSHGGAFGRQPTRGIVQLAHWLLGQHATVGSGGVLECVCVACAFCDATACCPAGRWSGAAAAACCSSAGTALHASKLSTPFADSLWPPPHGWAETLQMQVIFSACSHTHACC